MSKSHGQQGEKEVIRKCKCPNCGKKLMLLPPNYPMYDVQCTSCNFRAQIKTNQKRPRSIVFGAGWEILNKTTKSGYLIPPLIVNFKWHEGTKVKQEIRFYPFIPKNSLHKYKTSSNARRANYKMFNYTHLDELPHFVFRSRRLGWVSATVKLELRQVLSAAADKT